MKILLLASSKNFHTKRWVKALSEKEVSILLFSLMKDNSNFYTSLNNVKIIEFDLSGSLITRIKVFIKAILRLRKVAQEFNPDITNSHYITSYGLLGVLSGLHPHVTSVWGSDIYIFPKKSFIHRWLIKYNLKKVDFITSTSLNMKEEIKKYSDKKVELVPFGVDTDIFQPKDTQKNNEVFTIGIVKDLKQIYNINILIKATALLIKNNTKKIKLVIIGDGVERTNLEQLVSELEIQDNVEFKGCIKNEDLPDWYNDFSVFSVLSRSESFGVVVIEAMSSGCPVVCSAAYGFLEVIPKDAGFIVPIDDVNSTAIALQKLLDNPSLCVSMGKIGREHVLKNYIWKDNVNKMYSIYKNIIEQ